MKIRNVGVWVVMFYAFVTYVPQFFFHLLNEQALANHYRIGDGAAPYAGLILLFFLLTLLINKSIPHISIPQLGFARVMEKIFTSPLIVVPLCLFALVAAINYKLTVDYSFRQTQRLSSSGIAMMMLALKPYIYAWVLYNILSTVKGDETHILRTKWIAAFFLAALVLTISGSLNAIPVLWLTIFLLAPPAQLRNLFLHVNATHPGNGITKLMKLMMVCLLALPLVIVIITLGFINKYGLEGALNLPDTIGIVPLLEYLAVRLSSSYAAAISFSAYNLFNYSLYETAFIIPFESLAYHISILIQPDSPMHRPEITSISRLNYLNAYWDTDLEYAGASPGLVGSAFFAAPFPLGFIFVSVFAVSVIRMINFALRSIYCGKRFWMILMMVSFTFPLFESPVDYINFVQPGSLYLMLYFVVLFAISAHDPSVKQP